MARRTTVARKVGSRTLELSNLEKILFPADGITKGAIVDYYDSICSWILPHLKNRPLVLQRFPDGIDKFGFYQKQTSEHFPDWIETVRVAKEGGEQDLVVCNDRATLLYLANLAALTLHPWLSTAARVRYPDMLVVDLDPPSGQFEQARSAARFCRKLFDELELPVFLKTTGSKGLHLVVPLNGKDDFDAVRDLATDMMQVLATRHPEELTTEHRKAKRRGRVYLDIARNAYAQTAVAAYSVRAMPGGPVSAPIEWDELRRKSLDSNSYTIANVLRHVQTNDPWADMKRRRCSVATMRRRLAEL